MSSTRRLTFVIAGITLVVAMLMLASLKEREQGQSAFGSDSTRLGMSESDALARPAMEIDRVGAENALAAESGTATIAAAPAQELDGTCIQVLIDDAPATTGWVDVWEKVTEDGSSRYVSSDPRSEPIGRDGVAVFPGMQLTKGEIDVRLPGSAPLRALVHRADPGPVIALHLGTAIILGRVWRSNGQPAGDTFVSSMFSGSSAGAIDALGRFAIRRLEAKRKTDSDGGFAINHLPAEKFSVSAHPDGSLPIYQRGELARGELREIELGRPTGLVTLKGHLLDAVGNQVTDVRDPSSLGQLEFIAQTPKGREVYPANVTGNGAYRVSLAPATYVVRLRLQGSYHLEHEVHAALELTIDATVDLTIPGARVSGTASVAGSVHRFDPEYDGKWVKLILTNAALGHSYSHETLVGRDGRYAFHGISPGRWQLSGLRVVEPQATEIVIGPDDRDVVLDVVLRPRQAPNR